MNNKITEVEINSLENNKAEKNREKDEDRWGNMVEKENGKADALITWGIDPAEGEHNRDTRQTEHIAEVTEGVQNSTIRKQSPNRVLHDIVSHVIEARMEKKTNSDAQISLEGDEEELSQGKIKQP